MSISGFEHSLRRKGENSRSPTSRGKLQTCAKKVCTDIIKEYPSLTISNECRYIPRQKCSTDDVQPTVVTKPIVKKVCTKIESTDKLHCPDECSNQGICNSNDGTCSCYFGFSGDNCATSEGFSGRSNYFVLIAGQDDNTGKFDTAQVTDVADFNNPTHTCQTLASFPIGDDWFPQGGWVDGVLIVCSTKEDKECYAMSEDGSEWNPLSGVMTEKRRLGNGVVIKDKNGGPDKLWIIGPSASGDFIYSDGTIVAGDYPYEHRIERPCMVQLETGDVLVLCGKSSPQSDPQNRKVTRYDPATGKFEVQTPMIHERHSFACTTFKSAKHGGREVVYAAGGHESWDSAEVLDYTQTEEWEELDDLPFATQYGPRAVTNKDGTGVYHIYASRVTELTCDETSCSFSPKFDLTNQNVNRRSSMNILPIPDHLAICNSEEPKL